MAGHCNMFLTHVHQQDVVEGTEVVEKWLGKEWGWRWKGNTSGSWEKRGVAFKAGIGFA